MVTLSSYQLVLLFSHEDASLHVLCARRHFSKHRMLNGAKNIFRLEDYSVKLLIGLSWIDADCFPNPIQIGSTNLRCFVNMTMERQKRRMSFNERPYRTATDPAAVNNLSRPVLNGGECMT